MIYIFTAHYPFSGEPFLEDEIDWLSKMERKICVVPLGFHTESVPNSIPDNIEVVLPRKRRFEFRFIICALIKMLHPQTWKEKRFAYRCLGYSKKKIVVNKAIFMYYYLFYVLKRAIDRMEIQRDAFFYSYWMSTSAYFISNYKKHHPDITCVSRTHGGDCYIDKFYQPFRREILKNLDAVFPISEAGKKSIETLLVPHVEGRCVPLIVERLGVTKLSEKMNPPEKCEEFCIVTCSNVIALKRLDLMIDALAMLRDKKIHWVHFGDGEKMEEIQHQAEAKLSGSSIRYEFKGRVAKPDILEWYEEHHVDLFVNCSDSEGIPVSVMEAFSYGIPAVARNVGGIGELVKSGINGILLPAICTAEQLKDAISEIAEGSKDANEALCIGAYQTYQNDYCAEKNHMEFYEKIRTLHDN